MSLVPGAPFPTGIGGEKIRRTHQNYHTAVCEQVIAWAVTYPSDFTSFHFIPSLFSVESVCCLKNLRQSLVCSKSVQVLSEELDCRAQNRSRYLEISQSQIKSDSLPLLRQSRIKIRNKCGVAYSVALVEISALLHFTYLTAYVLVFRGAKK